MTNFNLSYKKRALRESRTDPIRRVFPNPVTYYDGMYKSDAATVIPDHLDDSDATRLDTPTSINPENVMAIDLEQQSEARLDLITKVDHVASTEHVIHLQDGSAFK